MTCRENQTCLIQFIKRECIWQLDLRIILQPHSDTRWDPLLRLQDEDFWVIFNNFANLQTMEQWILLEFGYFEIAPKLGEKHRLTRLQIHRSVDGANESIHFCLL